MQYPPLISPRSQRAFTLIELLTVIAIIGILAAIIIPTVGKVRETARTSQCASNMRQIAMGISLYAQDHRDTLPAVAGAGNERWYANIQSYLPLRAKSPNLENAVFVCPIAPQTYGVDESMIAISYIPGGGFAHISDNSKGRKMSSIVNPSRAAWLLDGARQGAGNSTAYSNYQLFDFNTDTLSSRVDFRHGGGQRINIAYADASVRGLAKSEIIQAFPDSLAWQARR